MFCCHLSIEKALKAVVQSQTGRLPPRLHDLRMLLARTRLTPPSRLKTFIDRMAGLSVPLRYPGPLSGHSAGLRRRQVERTIETTEKVRQWRRQNC
jgi:HEPN domain-containing protein